ncbi:MAG: hypothetical protein H6651_01790 [Ardenticatenales bacterium]|nr:hypothetical protein [Ardenticatenales bacterium]
MRPARQSFVYRSGHAVGRRRTNSRGLSYCHKRPTATLSSPRAHESQAGFGLDADLTVWLAAAVGFVSTVLLLIGVYRRLSRD